MNQRDARLLSSRPLRLAVPLAAACLLSAASPGQEPDQWPQWRGPNRDGVALSKGLLREWPEEGPPVLWQVDSAGVGYSSVAVAEGRVLTQGDLEGVEHVICLSAADGSLLWHAQPQPVARALRQRVQEQMQRADKNQNGVLEEAEALREFGWSFNDFDHGGPEDPAQVERAAQRRAADLVAALDKDGDQQLDYEELGRFLSRRPGLLDLDTVDESLDVDQEARRRAVALLAAADGDDDDRLSLREARRTELSREFRRADQREADLSRGDGFLTLDELIEYFTKFQPGMDGRIDSQELAAYYAKRLPQGDGRLTVDELRAFEGGYRDNRGDGPRGTPTVDGDRVYAEGGNGDVTCLDAATGRTIWHISLRDDYDGRRPGWGFSESPLIEGDLVIVTPGGRGGTLLALDKHTGEKVWQSEATEQAAHYSSPVAADIQGVRQIVQFARESVFGVDAQTGRLLWSYGNANNGTANCCTPIVHQNHVFASSAYGTGGGLARIVGDSQQMRAEEVYFEKKMANHHGGIVRLGDYMYGFGSGGLICMNFFTGEIMWTDRSVRKGSLLAADGMLYLLGEGHQVALAEANPKGYHEHGRFRIQDHSRPSWAHPALAGGVLLIRDQQSLTAYDVRAAR